VYFNGRDESKRERQKKANRNVGSIKRALPSYHEDRAGSIEVKLTLSLLMSLASNLQYPCFLANLLETSSPPPKPNQKALPPKHSHLPTQIVPHSLKLHPFPKRVRQKSN
jgi:hypothetical protein